MQTFVPYDEFRPSLECLDYRRLGKQRVESSQIINVISTGSTGAWSNHPAVNMWRGHLPALVAYYNLNLEIWADRGYNNIKLQPMEVPGKIVMPPWWGGPIHANHRANLLRKKPEFYGQYGWTEDPNMEYVWP